MDVKNILNKQNKKQEKMRKKEQKMMKKQMLIDKEMQIKCKLRINIDNVVFYVYFKYFHK